MTVAALRGAVVGAGSTYAQGSTGGAASVTLTAAQSGVPGHTHGIPGQTVTTGAMSANAIHAHSAPSGYDYGFPTDSHTKNAAAGTAVVASVGFQTTTNNTDISHTHSVTISATTSDSNTAAGAASAHENRPPYYALTFIIRKA